MFIVSTCVSQQYQSNVSVTCFSRRLRIVSYIMPSMKKNNTNKNNNNFATETLGVWDVQALELIGRRLTSTTFLRQHISVAVMRGTPNAFWGHSSHPIVVMFSNNDCDNLIY